MTAQILEQFQLASDSFTNLLANVQADQFAAGTPCTDWSVQELVGHVVNGNLMFVRLFTGAEPPVVDIAGDPAEAVSVSTKALREAASAEGALDRAYNTPMGERPGGRLMAVRVLEFSVHGWDLAEATGQSFEVPEAAIETCYAVLRAMFPETDRSGPQYGAVQEVGADATPTQKLAAFAGRAVAA
jgi:uncharacterized protein (TIGR03086 family)